MPAYPPLTHVALTVRDLSVSIHWYEALLDARPAADQRFSEFRVGLDHVAFGCADRAELEKWARRLDELGIAHGEIKDASYGSGLSFRDPDGVALEFFAPPA